ncbi:MAG: FUN14 domain-containing protein [Ignavibacteriae bacterium]|nr:FUN14 domain-containing protein [Ignavibacteriota bacterium]
MEEIIFALKSGGIGLLSGIAVGFISKKVSKILVFFIAVAFILIQVAIYNGYLEVDWLSWGNKAADLVKGADISTDSIKELFVRNVPFAIAALVGFIFGFKKG